MTGPLEVAEPVREALAARRPVVALETSVLAHGMPHPWSLRARDAMEAAIRAEGAEPAWISVRAGRLLVGTDPADLESLATERSAMKVARRDLPVAIASGTPGATTVSATLWAADGAGIEVTATGGIGGVHVGAGVVSDVSADLLEMAVTPGTLVCSGPKSIVDPVATLEKLEELGISVIGYGCDRLPFFLVREAGLPLEHRADTPEAVVAASRARAALGIRSTLLVCNPIPEEAALPAGEVEAAVGACLAEARSAGVSGKEVTPFLLACLARRTGNRTIEANLALLESNARLAAAIAAALLDDPGVA